MPSDHLGYIITYNWKKDTGYVHGVDFDLYPTYEDAKAGTNKFVCNYDYTNYFPGRCSPDGTRLNSEDSIFYGWSWGKSDVAFYVEKGVDSPDLNIVSTTTINSIDFEVDTFGENPYPTFVRSDGKGTYYITSSGYDLWWNYNDYTYFHSSEPVEGDLDISVKIGDVDAKDYWTKFGILIRETLEPLAKSAFTYVNRNAVLNLQWKTDPTNNYWRHTMRSYEPSYLRLTRIGSEFSFYWKGENDEEWKYWYKVTVEMNPSVYVGIGMSAKDRYEIAEAKFTEFSVKRTVSGIEASG